MFPTNKKTKVQKGEITLKSQSWDLDSSAPKPKTMHL